MKKVKKLEGLKSGLPLFHLPKMGDWLKVELALKAVQTAAFSDGFN